MRLETMVPEFVSDFEIQSMNVKSYVSRETVKTYNKCLDIFLSYLNNAGTDTSVNSITEPVLVAFMNKLVTDGKAPATRNLNLTVLKSFYRWAKKKYKIDGDPFKDIQPAYNKPKEAKCISDEDYITIMAEADKKCGMNQTIIKLLLQGGLRANELIALNNDDITFDSNKMLIRVRNGKGNKSRELPFVIVNEDGTENKENLKLRNLLKHQVNKNKFEFPEDPALFISNIGTRLSYQGLTARFKRFLDKLKLGDKGYHLHSCRHSMVRQLQKKKVGIHIIQAICGHSDSVVTQRIYGGHVTVEDIAKENRF